MELPVALLAVIERSLNAYLRLDGDVFGKNKSLQDKIIQLHIKGLDINLYSVVGAEDIQVLGEYVATPDATIAGSLAGLIRLSQSEDSASAMLESDVEISGDMRVAEGFSRLLSEASIDWEELLSKVVGDIPAYQMGNTVRKGNEWVAETNDAMKNNLAEYLSEESRMVPAKAEVNVFMEAVDDLRMDVDRLDARIKLIKTISAGDVAAK